jgi:RNA 3'-terminal phosphate cyclase (ATP)
MGSARAMSRGEYRRGYAEAYIAGVPLHVANRELQTVGSLLQWAPEQLHVRGLPGEVGPGNAITMTVEHEKLTEVFTGFGEKSVSAEQVAKSAADRARQYLASSAAVGRNLADQLLLPMALGAGGAFTTLPLSAHFRSHAEIIRTFLDREVSTKQVGEVFEVTV